MEQATVALRHKTQQQKQKLRPHHLQKYNDKTENNFRFLLEQSDNRIQLY